MLPSCPTTAIHAVNAVSSVTFAMLGCPRNLARFT